MYPDNGQRLGKENEIKVPTDRELTYAALPCVVKVVERMKADHKDDILQAAQALVNRGGKV